jgi:hypothetical protein
MIAEITCGLWLYTNSAGSVERPEVSPRQHSVSDHILTLAKWTCASSVVRYVSHAQQMLQIYNQQYKLVRVRAACTGEDMRIETLFWLMIEAE